ncbi:EAL domain-containing protein [Ensifer sp. Root127]|uniref:EAL domain-containing protein n=1 Tax=Ensifer sp. Root127 TaxID=1736440 RepID=UPI00070CF76E|nr:EAL domain-containing protein [Ensifer sp. Root127]KQW72431.1 hypothetical protein ASD03_32290 [Ensifer sp. Root127]
MTGTNIDQTFGVPSGGHAPFRLALHSLLWRLLIPTFIAVSALVIGVALYAPSAIIDDALNHAVDKNASAAEKFKILREVYSESVISNIKGNGVVASPSFHQHAGSIPEPTTFLLKVARAFDGPTMRFDIVSPYPWPARAAPSLDQFQLKAWAYLERDPGGRFVERDASASGGELLRVAVADRMGAPCVACHNGDPLSPKRDWKVGDVGGIIEVASPIGTISEGARNLAWKLTFGIIFGGLLLLSISAVLGMRLLKPLRDLSRYINQVALNDGPCDVPHLDRRDELGTVARAVCFLHEQTRQRNLAEARVRHLARHDVLTGLFNRNAFIEQAEERLADPHSEHAVLCFDLDHFKVVNDTKGHPVGDRLLIEVGKRLSKMLGPGEFIGRMGGDEFAIFQSDGNQPVAASRLAERLIETLREPYEINGYQIPVGASIGIALAAPAETNLNHLLNSADLALYRAKSGGRGIFRFFEEEMDARIQERRSLELDLRHAVSNNEFEVYYQPLMRLKDNCICGFEALVRWDRADKGFVSPAEFIPLAEETGLIAAIGSWVLKTACQEAAQWPSEFRIAVNLSPLQLNQPTVVTDVISALEEAGLPPYRLELEITESAMVQDTAENLASLHRLRDLGVRISLDDFGTGYSSLSYLQKFPFDKIKIDQSFMRNISSGGLAVSIVRAITGLAAELGITTTAEGIETIDQLEQARAFGCHEVQGYLISRPGRAASAAELIQIQKRNESFMGESI